MLTVSYRVEDLVPSLGGDARNVHFSSLRKSIRDLQEASAKHDIEKELAEADFEKLLKKLPIPGRRGFARNIKRRTGPLRRAADWVKSVFGVPPPNDAELHMLSLRNAESWEEYLEYAVDVVEGPDAKDIPLPYPIRRFIEAAKRIGRANRRLRDFERGFISEEGIKDREWYKHLGVAPGKWLGTFFSHPH